MRTLIHLSDIHFGKVDFTPIDKLVSEFKKINPNLIIVSGDFTQRATVDEFKQAAALLKGFKDAGLPYLVIPGNHDIVPLYSPLNRMTNPYKHYRQYISETLDPVYRDEEIAVAAINSTRYTTLKNGRIDQEQLEKVEKWFASIPEDKVKMVVTHHPLDLPITWKKRKLIHRAQRAMSSLSKYAVDIYFSGHHHISSAVSTSDRYAIKNYSAIAVQAGTVSTRQRGEVQSFNVLTIDKPNITIETHLWDSKDNLFSKFSIKKFICTDEGWKLKE